MLFAEVIKARRTELGLSRAEVAAAVGVRVETIAGWESGQRSPRPSRIGALAAVLRLDAEALLEVRFCDNPAIFSPAIAPSFRSGRAKVHGWGGKVLVSG